MKKIHSILVLLLQLFTIIVFVGILAQAAYSKYALGLCPNIDIYLKPIALLFLLKGGIVYLYSTMYLEGKYFPLNKFNVYFFACLLYIGIELIASGLIYLDSILYHNIIRFGSLIIILLMANESKEVFIDLIKNIKSENE